jgi:hypothetical protein
MNRRTYLQTSAVAATVVAAAGLTKFVPHEDLYDKFLRQVGDHVRKIVQREHRSLEKFWIDPVDLDGYRLCWLKLDGIASPYTWNQRAEYVSQ